MAQRDAHRPHIGGPDRGPLREEGSSLDAERIRPSLHDNRVSRDLAAGVDRRNGIAGVRVPRVKRGRIEETEADRSQRASARDVAADEEIHQRIRGNVERQTQRQGERGTVARREHPGGQKLKRCLDAQEAEEIRRPRNRRAVRVLDHHREAEDADIGRNARDPWALEAHAQKLDAGLAPPDTVDNDRVGGNVDLGCL